MIHNTTNKPYLTSIFLFFIALTSFGQSNKDSLLTKESFNTLDQKTVPNSVQDIILSSLYDNRPNYIYNNSKDTIQLSSVDSSYGLCQCTPPKIISAIQIDQKGAKEIVFYRKCFIKNEFYQSSYRQTINTTLKKYEIWNLDTKQLLFEARTYYKSHFDGIHPDPATVPRNQKSIRHYQYHFTINKKGKIKIKQLRGKLKVLAKIKEGTYLFKNGKYRLGMKNKPCQF